MNRQPLLREIGPPLATIGLLLLGWQVGVTASGRFKFVIAEGESVRGPIPPTGNTNTRAFFEPDVRTFLKRWVAEGPTHHFALGVGRHGRTLQKIADILDIQSVIVTALNQQEDSC